MNSTDKKSLVAFKAMFAALSQSVKRKYENKANEAPPPPAGPTNADLIPLGGHRRTPA